MIKFAFPLIFVLVACGGQEQPPGAATPGDGAQAPLAEAGSALGEAGSALGDVAGGALEAVGADATIQDCLGLVKEQRFGDAIPVCTEAVQQNPESTEAKSALERAKEAAGEAASEALGEAQDAAVEDTGEGLKNLFEKD